jgi:hypothetical protein
MVEGEGGYNIYESCIRHTMENYGLQLEVFNKE